MSDPNGQASSDLFSQTDEPPVDELAILKNRAAMLGISHSNNIGVDALRKKIEEKLAEGDKSDQSDEAEGEHEGGDDEGSNELNPEPQPEASQKVVSDAAPLQPREIQVPQKLTLRQHCKMEAEKLVRLRITNLDPKKKDLHGEIVTVANEYIGTIRKFVPFGAQTDQGYHVPHCIYEYLRDREFLNIKVTKLPGTNREKIETAYAREFALEVLPPLTPDELGKLAAAQQAAGSLEG